MLRGNMEIQLVSNAGESFTFRELRSADVAFLGEFFEHLSEQTRSKFGPHPLTKIHASDLCNNIGKDNTVRFVISNQAEVVGYFILDFNVFADELKRYSELNISLDSTIDPVFAPCIADKYQNSGLASQAMKGLTDYAKSNKLRCIVLMGGTQQPNLLARSFYTKFGFKEYSEFYTEHNGLNNIDMMLTLNRI